MGGGVEAAGALVAELALRFGVRGAAFVAPTFLVDVPRPSPVRLHDTFVA